jgi:hypothetical protein
MAKARNWLLRELAGVDDHSEIQENGERYIIEILKVFKLVPLPLA